MRLFHISEEPNIDKFVPRIPYRKDLDQSKGLVWAINERCLPNFLTPRNCPRVTYHAHASSTQTDIATFFSSQLRHVVAIEQDWHKRMLETTLYIYEFDSTHFYLQDEAAGFYVSEQAETPISVTKYENLYAELFSRNVEVRVLDNLWQLGKAVQQSTLHWSLCRMANAKPPLKGD